jgi:hypothetical protein
MTRKTVDTLGASTPAAGESMPQPALVFWWVCYNGDLNFGV